MHPTSSALRREIERLGQEVIRQTKPRPDGEWRRSRTWVESGSMDVPAVRCLVFLCAASSPDVAVQFVYIFAACLLMKTIDVLSEHVKSSVPEFSIRPAQCGRGEVEDLRTDFGASRTTATLFGVLAKGLRGSEFLRPNFLPHSAVASKCRRSAFSGKSGSGGDHNSCAAFQQREKTVGEKLIIHCRNARRAGKNDGLNAAFYLDLLETIWDNRATPSSAPICRRFDHTMNTIPKKLGRYQILSELGRGAMGVVYKAYDPVIERDVAAKAIQLAFQVSPEEKHVYLNRFYREAKAAGKLNHPNIVTIYDVDEDKETGTPFIVMEFLEGTTLQEIVNDGILLPVADVKAIIMQIADALNYAHKQGVVHRDVKSANIILVEGMKCKIMDFGIARISTSDLTKSGQFIGTPNYMSPEQIDGKAMVDGRSDLFALGVIFYLLLTGERPFSGDSFTSISYKIVHVEPLPPRVINPGVPEAYNKILARLMAKDPAQRYSHGADLIEDLKKTNALGGSDALEKAELFPVVEEPTVLSDSAIIETLDKEAMPVDEIASRQTVTIPGQKIPKAAVFSAVILLVAVLVGIGAVLARRPPVAEDFPVSPVMAPSKPANKLRKNRRSARNGTSPSIMRRTVFTTKVSRKSTKSWCSIPRMRAPASI